MAKPIMNKNKIHIIDRYVLLGNHRDAWVFGAVDPSSGTASMMELSRVFAQMIKNGNVFNIQSGGYNMEISGKNRVLATKKMKFVSKNWTDEKHILVHNEILRYFIYWSLYQNHKIIQQMYTKWLSKYFRSRMETPSNNDILQLGRGRVFPYRFQRICRGKLCINLLHGRGAMLNEMIRKCQRVVKTVLQPGSSCDYFFYWATCKRCSKVNHIIVIKQF